MRGSHITGTSGREARKEDDTLSGEGLFTTSLLSESERGPGPLGFHDGSQCGPPMDGREKEEAWVCKYMSGVWGVGGSGVECPALVLYHHEVSFSRSGPGCS